MDKLCTKKILFFKLLFSLDYLKTLCKCIQSLGARTLVKSSRAGSHSHNTGCLVNKSRSLSYGPDLWLEGPWD